MANNVPRIRDLKLFYQKEHSDYEICYIIRSNENNSLLLKDETQLKGECKQLIVPTKCTLLFTYECYVYSSTMFRRQCSDQNNARTEQP